MSDEIAQVVEQDVARPMLQAVEDIGETVPTHFEGIGERLEGAAAAHLDNEAGIVSDIQGINPATAESEAAGAAESGASSMAGNPVGGSSPVSGETPPEPLTGQDPVAQAQEPGGQGQSDDPVDLVSGEMFFPQRDVELPGLLPLVLERTHRSYYRSGRWFGRTWASTLDQRVELDDDGIHYAAPDGVVLHYPVPQHPAQRVLPSEGSRWPLDWDRAGDTIRIEQPQTGLTLHFPPGPTPEVSRPLTAVTDRNGNRVTIVRDDETAPTAVYHSGGYHLAVERDYTAAGTRVAALVLIDPASGAGTTLRRFGYDAAGRLTQVTNTSGIPMTFEYDEQDRVTAWNDRNGYRYEYHYGPDGRVIRTDGTGGCYAATFAYDLEARTTTLTDALGHATVHHWNERGQVYKVVDPLGGVTQTEQDRYNRVLSRTDALGRTTRYTLDEWGNQVRIERPDGAAIEVDYNDLCAPTRVTAADGAVWHYSHDERGNLTEATDPLGAVTRYEYDERGALLAVTNPLGQATRHRVDAAGRRVETDDPRGGRTATAYDAFGRISMLTDALGAVTRVSWTPEGKLASLIAPDGSREEWTYDGEGNLVEYRDTLGAATRFEYSPFDKPISRTDPTGARYEFAYDTRMRLVSVTNPQGMTWRYEYDAADRLIRETDFDGRTLTYRYDAAGQLLERVNGAGESVVFDRDELGLVRERRAAGAVTRFTRDAAGRMLRAESPESTLEYTWDAAGRLLAESVDGRILANEYDAAGRRLRRTTPTGAISQWAYDPDGLPTALATTLGSMSFAFDAEGREVGRYIGTQAAVSQEFDAAGRLVAQALWSYARHETESAGPRLLHQRGISYRSDGYPTEIADSLHGTRRYEVDQVGRVNAVRADGWTETYAYDELGYITHAGAEQERTRDWTGEREYAGSLVRRAGRVHYERDAQGRLVRTIRRTLSGQRRTWTYTWDADDRLTGVGTPDGDDWRYAYDPLGRRTAKRRVAADGAVLEEVWFFWDGLRLAEQVTTSSDGHATAVTWDWMPAEFRVAAQTRRRWALDAPQSQVDGVFYGIVTDLVGTPTELLTADGRIAWHSSTSLWGVAEPAADTEAYCPLRFPGQYHDPETGLNYNLLRYYDPETGTYTGPDPLGLAPAPGHHAYVDNPLVAFDPFGLADYNTNNRNLSDTNPVPRPIREQYEEIKLGRGTPRIDPNTGSQTIFQGNELTPRQRSQWGGSLEWDVPGTSHRILQRPDGMLGYVLNHDYSAPFLFPGPWYPEGGAIPRRLGGP